MSKTHRKGWHIGLVAAAVIALLAIVLLLRGHSDHAYVGKWAQDNPVTGRRSVMEFTPHGVLNTWLEDASGHKSELRSFTYREVQAGQLDIRSSNGTLQHQLYKMKNGSLHLLNAANSDSPGWQPIK